MNLISSPLPKYGKTFVCVCVWGGGVVYVCACLCVCACMRARIYHMFINNWFEAQSRAAVSSEQSWC